MASPLSLLPESPDWGAPVELCEEGGVVWLMSHGLVSYPAAVAFMETRTAEIAAGVSGEAVWLLEHPPLYTAGTSAADDELLDAARFPVYRCGRGGRYTYHGPGQRVVYVMLDLRHRARDVRAFVAALEQWVIATLAELGVASWVAPGRIGVWARANGEEAKIAALGVRIRHWISYHGLAINLAPDLEHFRGIIPCGLNGFAVTSVRALGNDAGMRELDTALIGTFGRIFGPIDGTKPK